MLSVPTFTDRIAHIQRELRGIDFEFIFDAPDANVSPGLGPRHKSLVLKHLHAWRLACENGHQRILVFEDDVILARRFQSRLKAVLQSVVGNGWLVFLAGGGCKVPVSFFKAPGPLVPHPIDTAEGYVTDLEACRRRVEWCTTHEVTLPADGLIRHVDAACGITQYWLTEPIVEQGSVTGRFGSFLDGHRMKHSRLVNAARYRWNRFTRWRLRRWLAKFS